MDAQKILGKVDHTLLRATATWPEIEVLCDEAIQYKTASVCIPPAFVGPVFDKYGDALVICTVVGFPLGYNTTATKLFETKDALVNGAGEIDMVVNLGDIKTGDFDKVTAEIAALKEACGDKILKVIIETCYLDEAEKIALCRCVTDGGADFIKTSTGFGTAGATLEDVALLRRHIGPHVKIKAAGGIRTLESLVAFDEAGCDRIGASAAVKLLGGNPAGGDTGSHTY